MARQLHRVPWRRRRLLRDAADHTGAGAYRHRTRAPGTGAAEVADQKRDRGAKLRPPDNEIDHAGTEEGLGAVGIDGLRLVEGQVDYPRPHEPDFRTGFSDENVGQGGKARRDTAEGGIGEDRNV